MGGCSLNKTFGDRIKILRKFILRQNRADFCTTHGISEPSLRSWEGNKVEISEKNLNRLIQCFRDSGIDLSTEWFINGIGSFPTLVNEKVAFSIETNKIYIEHEISTKNFSPILPKGTKLYLLETSYENVLLDIPNFYAIKTLENNMHYGLITKCMNGLLMKSYEKKFYEIFIDKNIIKFYKIVNISQPEQSESL